MLCLDWRQTKRCGILQSRYMHSTALGEELPEGLAKGKIPASVFTYVSQGRLEI